MADGGSSARAITGKLTALQARFVDLYQPSLEVTDFLTRQIATIGHHADELPTVFQHGDPGPWNIMVTPDDEIAFLDWESADPAGIPLWDLFYFLRSRAVSIGRNQGIADRLECFRQQFLDASPFAELVVESIVHYTQIINLPAELIRPIFYTCWMHRALKEATRLTPSQMRGGHYFSLLQMCIQWEDSWTLTQLFEPGPAGPLANLVQKQALAWSGER
jgi:hypothetical protein